MLLTVSIVLGFKQEIIRKITGLTCHISISSINRNASNEQEPVKISADTLTSIRKLPFVKHIQATALKHGLLKTDTENEGILLKGVGKEYDFEFLKKHLISGDLPDVNGSEPGKDILVSEALTRKLNIHLNDKLQLYFIAQHEVYDSTAKSYVIKSEQRSRKLRVCGIFKTDFADFDEKLSIVDLRQIQKLNYWDPTIAGSYEILVTNFQKTEEDVEQIGELLGYNYSINSVQENYANIFTWLEKLDINGVIVVVLMVIVATINMITALLILILERAQMIGLIKALGMGNASVRRIFVIVSLRLTGKGMLLGNIIGIGLCLLQFYFRFAKLDGDTYYVDYVVVELNGWYILLLNLGTFAVCSLMLLLPTLILAKITPIRTLKFD
jgi:lipoprotein-releasing system permease protein